MTTAAWSTLEPALDALFTRIATVPGSVPSVTGSKGPSAVGQKLGKIQFPAPSNPVTLEWYPVAVAGVGKDELRERYDPETLIEGDTYEPDPGDPDARLGAIIQSLHGQRVWTFEVRIESHNQSNPASEHFRALVDRMRLPSAAAELEAIGLAWTGWDEMVDDAYDGEDGRAISVYVGRLFFNGSSFAEDTPITTIEVANITTNVLP